MFFCVGCHLLPATLFGLLFYIFLSFCLCSIYYFLL
nr:MAG TPA: hypothetical protein [Caudoviricetes sp.]